MQFIESDLAEVLQNDGNVIDDARTVKKCAAPAG